MFEWLEREIALINTPRFHLIDGPANTKLQETVTQSPLPVPSAYKEFIRRFGNAKLYRKGRNDSYRVGVFAGPREAVLDDGTRIYHLGFDDGASVYVKPTSDSTAFQIFEHEDGVEEESAENFEEWLKISCARARGMYSLKQWAEIVHGPQPFTQEEEELLEARRRIHWRIVGTDAQGNHLFNVTNDSGRTLPFLTVGIRSRDGQLNGAIRLETGKIGPGQAMTLHADCYRRLKSPSEIEAFALPDPRPEDREFYYEFER